MDILILEDDPRLALIMQDALTLAGDTYHPVVTHTAHDALEIVHQRHIDCVLCDLMLPGLNGYQFIQSLRGDPDTAQIPIVIVSALAEDRDRYIGKIVGADVYLVKPVRIPDLIAGIHQAIQVSATDRRHTFSQLIRDEEEQ